jgi:hypothetical protein
MPHKRHLDSAQDQPLAREPLAHERTWQCQCGSALRIRAGTDRGDGPSNFLVDTNPRRRTFGHALLPSGELTWEGLREERGWERDGDVVTCPACAMGRTRDEHRVMSRFQPERIGAEIAARQITRQSRGAIQAEAVFAALGVRGAQV